jgi:hypothetical protein
MRRKNPGQKQIGTAEGGNVLKRNAQAASIERVRERDGRMEESLGFRQGCIPEIFCIRRKNNRRSFDSPPPN